MTFTRRRHRRVRLHLRDGAPSIEGVLVARTGGHYVIWTPRVLVNEDADGTVAISGHVEVPERNVMFVQVIG